MYPLLAASCASVIFMPNPVEVSSVKLVPSAADIKDLIAFAAFVESSDIDLNTSATAFCMSIVPV